MKTEMSYPNFEKNFKLSWGKPFFVCAGLAGLYYVAYLAFLLHVIVKSGTHFF
ncbi:MAG TPA: hypothetical protein VMI12_04975 [Puia sp.]|nr:hypothetical protein [Puia sp.]